MTPVDFGAVGTALNGLAEVYDRKNVSAKALEVWLDMLKEFEGNRILSLLHSWPKTHTKFPAPNEVWKALNDDAIGKREAVAQAEKKAFAEAGRRMERSPEADARFKEALALLKTPKPTPEQHWRKVLNTPGLPAISYRYANEYLARFSPQREPGQDDEEISTSDRA